MKVMKPQTPKGSADWFTGGFTGDAYAVWEALTPDSDTPESEWGEHVTDEEYNKYLNDKYGGTMTTIAKALVTPEYTRWRQSINGDHAR